jgi:uncharacterized membrane protein
MTDNSQNFAGLQERNEQTLNDIKSLQTTEMQLYDSLDKQELTNEQKQQIIDKINQISQTRINLYANLKDLYSYYQQNVSASRDTLGEQMVAVDVIENELNESKRRLNLLEDQKYNKLRMVEINTYYGKKYNAHKKIMQTVVFTCLPLLIVAVLANKGILPNNISTLLAGIIIVIGAVLIGMQIIDISNRDNMNFDEYNWYFDPNDAPTGDGDIKNPWETGSIVCIGCIDCIGCICCICSIGCIDCICCICSIGCTCSP